MQRGVARATLFYCLNGKKLFISCLLIPVLLQPEQLLGFFVSAGS